jgi:hypothetical protein
MRLPTWTSTGCFIGISFIHYQIAAFVVTFATNRSFLLLLTPNQTVSPEHATVAEPNLTFRTGKNARTS